jgi:tetratricopeptide (TPR) repeat protein
MNTNDFSYFIEKYISNEMGIDEKIWFEKELDGNTALQKELKLRRQTESIIANSDVMDLRTKLNTIGKERAAREVVYKSRKTLIMNFAAGFAGLLLIGSLIFLSSNNLSKEAIYNKYYKSYEAVSATRSATSTVSSLYSEAITYYNERNYEKAAKSLEQLLSTDEGNIEYRFQLANSYMGMQSYPNAGKSYIKVIEDNNNLYIEDAQWYLGICYVMTNDNEKAINQLSLIASSDSRYKKEARQLLKKIK